MFGRPWPRAPIVAPTRGPQGRPNEEPEDARSDAGEPVRARDEAPRARPWVNPFALLAPMALRRRRDAVLAGALPALVERQARERDGRPHGPAPGTSPPRRG